MARSFLQLTFCSAHKKRRHGLFLLLDFIKFLYRSNVFIWPLHLFPVKATGFNAIYLRHRLIDPGRQSTKAKKRKHAQLKNPKHALATGKITARLT
jgi:hypothetical protein